MKIFTLLLSLLISALAYGQGFIGTAETFYTGTQEIITDTIDGQYCLKDYTRGNGVFTYDITGSILYDNAICVGDEDNYWSLEEHESITDIHWGTAKYYDFLLETFGRNSLDDEGMPIISYALDDIGLTQTHIHMNSEENRIVYKKESYNAFESHLETVSRVLSQLMLIEIEDYHYSYQNNILRYSFDHIMSYGFQQYMQLEEVNWQFGEMYDYIYKDMSNPKSLNLPDTYMGQYWSNNKRYNSAVVDHWFYLLTDGGSGTNDNFDDYSVDGIGWESAIAIVYKGFNEHFENYSTLEDAREFTHQAAIDLFGACSFEAIQVAEAWFAVGVGYDPYVPLLDFDTNNQIIYCEDRGIQFDSGWIEDGDFLWDFGDGTVSTEADPLHFYEDQGEYVVSFTYEVVNCLGEELAETIILEDTIRVNHCYDYEWHQNIEEYDIVINDCSGVLNEDYNYVANGSSLLISPEGADQLRVLFNDYYTICADLKIYDGTEANEENLISTPQSGDIIIFESGSVYMEANLNGWGCGCMAEYINLSLTWECEYEADIPSANFSPDVVESCEGIVSFRDLSSQWADEWYWDFGDGQNSTEGTPTHQYMNSGIYDVSLVSCNELGCDTLVYEDLISINFGCIVSDTISLVQAEHIISNECSGVIRDADFDTDQSSAIYTIEVPEASAIEVNLERYKFYSGSYLKIYDGPDTDSPLIQNFVGYEDEETVIVSSSNSITIKEFSYYTSSSSEFLISYESDGTAEAMANFEAPVKITPHFPIQFMNSSEGTNYVWNFGDGSVDLNSNPIHNYEDLGIYEVTLTAFRCGNQDSISQSIEVVEGSNMYEVLPESIAVNLLAGSDTTIAISIVNQDENILGMRLQSENLASWLNVEGLNEGVIVGANETHNYQLHINSDDLLVDNYESSIQLVAYGSTIETYHIPITLAVESFPQAIFSSPSTDICNGMVEFHNETINNASDYWWDFGDGSSSTDENPQHIYAEEGIYDISLVACNNIGCDTTIYESYIDYGTVTAFCNQYTIPTDLSISEISNCTAKVIANDVHTYGGVLINPPNDHPIHLYITSISNNSNYDDEIFLFDGPTIDAPRIELGEQDTIITQSDQVLLLFSEFYYYNLDFELFYWTEGSQEEPTANFEIDNLNPPLNYPVQFSNLSSNAAAYFWDFGDGNTSSEKNPTHTYQNSGNYEVSLVSYNCVGSSTAIINNLNVDQAAIMAYNPDTLYVDLATGTTENSVINISNNGGGKLAFEHIYTNGLGVHESSQSSFLNKETIHSFEMDKIVVDSINVTITINGNYLLLDNKAQIFIENELIGEIGADTFPSNGIDITQTFSYSIESVQAWLQDDLLEVRVKDIDNYPYIGAFHKVEVEAFGHPCLSAETNNLELDANENYDWPINIDATGMYGGIYESNVKIEHNDANQSPINIPVVINVEGFAEATLSTNNIHFENVQVLSEEYQFFQITQSGTADLVIYGYELESELFTVNLTDTLTVGYHESINLNVSFAPIDAVSYTANLMLLTNIGPIEIVLTGEGVDKPNLSFEAANFELEINETNNDKLILTNTGDGPLELYFQQEELSFWKLLNYTAFSEGLVIIEAGESYELYIELSSIGLDIDLHESSIPVSTNIPNIPYLDIPIRLQVFAYPVAELEVVEIPDCSASFQFVDRSSYDPISWEWDFGDGNTSNEKSPLHTYSESGIYDINLYICNDFGCDQIHIDDMIVNIEDNCQIIAFNEEESVYDECAGIIYDDGGLVNNYSDAFEGTTIIEVADAAQIELHFEEFDLGNCCDVLSIYDGKTNEDELIGEFYTTSLLGETIYSSSNAIRLEFVTNEVVNGTGFKIAYQCQFATNIEDDNKANFQLYPNPNNGQFQLELAEEVKDLAVNIYNVNGQKVHQESIQNPQRILSLDAKLAAGVYYVELIQEDQIQHHSLIIND